MREPKEIVTIRCMVDFPGQHMVTLPKETVTLLNKRTTRIHPAIDFVEGKAFIGLFLPSQVRTERKKERGEEQEYDVKEEDRLWLVSSDRCLRYAGDYQHLRSQGLILTNRPLSSSAMPRWDLDDLADWLTPKGAEEAISKYPLLSPESVHTAVKDALLHYLEFPDDRDADFWTLKVIETYFARLFDACAVSYIGGIKQTGKTKLLIVASLMAFNGMLSVSMSNAAFYRIIQDARGSLFIDETEKLHDAERNQIFRSIILAAYKRGHAVHRVEGEEVKAPTPFEIYTPVFIANIHGIEDVLEDRAISRVMLRALNPEIRKQEPSITDPRWRKIRSGLYRLYLERAAEIARMKQDSDASDSCDTNVAGIEGRELELWQPILILARFFEKHGVKGLTEKIASLAKEIGTYKVEENLTEATDMVLLQVLYEMVTKDDYYPVSTIKEKLVALVAEDPKQPPRWLTTDWVGRALKRSRIGVRRRLGTHREYRITPAQVKDLMQRVGATLLQGTSEPASHESYESRESPPVPPAPAAVPDIPTSPKIGLREEKGPHATFRCKLCPAQYSSKEQLEEHQTDEHGLQKEKKK